MSRAVRLPPPLNWLYTLYALSVFVPLGLLALLGVLLLPTMRLRRSTAHYIARAWLWLTGMRLDILRPDHLPAGQCVVVANHASYLDGFVMTAALPPRFGFVIKREASRLPLAGLLLARIGSEFVERFNRHKGASDARRVVRNAGNGHSFVFFPEGTFAHQPGLMKFHSGAFMTAARAGCPVVPCVIRGTRDAWPAKRLGLLPARLEVQFLPPLPAAQNGDEQASVTLRDCARRDILAALGEPDLSEAA
ncbi:MAG TPA: lysophospholipid acyltransferase family protein [Steroidobacteraceae bacterium]|nr:lysophospholipid acyltransferase family protein [Steroidobacteraceae bacterium]HNS28319.1 lysophospholipid acyltransferase family protein [Steroidobacteraceae bacterium]